MKLSTADELADRMEQLDLVQAAQLDSIWGELGGRNVPVADLGAALVRRELVTSYQLDRVVRGEEQGFFYGRAKILYQVGAGSFSRVYRAIHMDTGQILAVKVLRSRYSSDQDKRQAFQREAEMGRLLHHPNIVAIEDVGIENNSSYITMEFVEGQTLRELVRVRGAIDLPRAIGLILQLAEGLEYAHRRGVTHRDLKASNVLISFTGQAKLVDFGLAGGDAAVSKVVRGKGQPRTVDYAALESLGGVKDDSVRSDIYFFGTIAYLALSGVSPLKESRDRSVRSDPRRFTSVESLGFKNPDLPRDVIEVVSRMMQINPVERWQTVMEVRRALEPLAVKYAVGAGGKSAAGTAAAAGGHEPHRAAAGAKQPAAPQAATKGTLMLVETSPQDQAELRGVFKDLGYRVLLTENLDRAMVRCSATPRAADCLVISANSCGEEGVEVFNRLAQDDFLRTLPAVLLVDPAQPDLVALARPDDLRQIVTTPPQPEALGKVLDGLFGRV